ncbi:MAG TPA: succinate dehydrogenase assembly factor 2 [Hyphomicrobiaceae bacterium]|jgi:antitoxin CptB|nr:succinate dehydrogenase assembly factor 2 [Hyphomicrobiaceae bacterium]
MHEDLETRRRRAYYRAWHRGTKEMDWILGRFADSALAEMSPEALQRFEALLALPDPDLQQMIIDGDRPGEAALWELIDRLRAFHGLG